MTKEERRDQVRRRCETLGITIIKHPSGGYRLYGRNGFLDFRVADLADVPECSLNPRRWA